jgi:hypothetical protein
MFIRRKRAHLLYIRLVLSYEEIQVLRIRDQEKSLSLLLRSLFPKTITSNRKSTTARKTKMKKKERHQNNNNNKIKTRKEEREKSTCFCSTAGPRSLSSPLLFRVIAVRLPILVIIIIFITLNEEEEDTEEEEGEECIRPRHRRR